MLGLFEGVVTGAADGYGRMAGKPAVTLLHLGPGYANGIANLHNARRAGTPIVNVIGDHATYHRQYDAPLTSDIAGLARPNSCWLKMAETADQAADLAAEAVRPVSASGRIGQPDPARRLRLVCGQPQGAGARPSRPRAAAVDDG